MSLHSEPELRSNQTLPWKRDARRVLPPDVSRGTLTMRWQLIGRLQSHDCKDVLNNAVLQETRTSSTHVNFYFIFVMK